MPPYTLLWSIQSLAKAQGYICSARAFKSSFLALPLIVYSERLILVKLRILNLACWVLSQFLKFGFLGPFSPFKWPNRKKKYLHGKEWSKSENKNSSETSEAVRKTWQHAKFKILNFTKIRIPLMSYTPCKIEIISFLRLRLIKLDELWNEGEIMGETLGSTFHALKKT